MPRRGPPPLTKSSQEEGLAAQGLDSGRESEFSVFLNAVEQPFTSFSIVAYPVDRKTATFGIVVHPVKRVQVDFGIITNAITVVGSTISTEAFRIETRAVAPTGYPSPARLSTFRSVPVGPVVRRRGEVIPPAE